MKNPKLHAVYPSGQVPDLRGRFIRGWAHGSGEDPDPGRGVTSYQDQSDLTHYHHVGRFGNNWGQIRTMAIFRSVKRKMRGRRIIPGRAICGDKQSILEAQIPQGLTGPASRTFSTSNQRYLATGEVSTQPDVHPKNIALMYIVKTDQADNIAPEPTPTNIVVTPSTLSIGVGETQNLRRRCSR